MKTQNKLYWLILAFVFLLSGCVVRTYQSSRERMDQDLEIGNRGYLKGQAPYAEPRAKKRIRNSQVVEVELHSPIRFEKIPHPKTAEKAVSAENEDKQIWGNRGYITQSESLAIIEPARPVPQVKSEKYIVQKRDTLQKISQKYYGTTKKWTKIFDANKDVLKGPNKIYPGQSLNIPGEALEETKENLK